ncbi:hypothetical protein IMCC14465_08480 [alpha proteobacterium IMCC14465]|uniref:1-(5-phosphoribosyl)-5-[(5-phosphoribosylamino)methylideneamino] imidazole-4-carboxamide isomerase n=1 Tax=alpha proteobacterium IMCC14465 TaxID=1220535 RepID=J9DVN9_9PROT|nr:hypothetical protein IMCC14465_08480 [alpha proteobacterium IMCC14465]
MILFPAIDLKGGQCVRLEQGKMDRATVFNDDPAAQAAAFQSQGFSHLHLVDLDGAFAGAPVNVEAVDRILAATQLTTQLGGGIRDLPTIERWLSRGIGRVILGTAAVRNPELVIEACRAFPDQIIVGIDARDGKVAVEGWAETGDMEALDLAKKFEDVGVAAIVYTDIDRDGMLQGINVEATATLARGIDIPVIASGGLASSEDLEKLLAVETHGVTGVISGRALYDGRLDAADALAMEGIC